MKKTTARLIDLKYNFVMLFFLFNTVLSVIGIFAAMEAMKIDQYGSPLLYALPFSTFFWFLLAFFVKIPTEEEMEAIKKLHASPDAKSPPKIAWHIFMLVKGIIMALFVIMFLTEISMILVIGLKMAIESIR